ncbi:MAG: DUF4365 domain-containing protein [Dehalococcoidia bacterium]|nr:DUF4365 domain-containing protein [Dehalococcoidia bacterium]
MFNDSLTSTADREESLSRAYVYAVTAIAGYTFSEANLDRDGIDLRIHAGGLMKPSIGLQLKATFNLGELGQDGNYRYDLRIEDYKRLIEPSQTPQYLVVLSLPKEEGQWLDVSDYEFVIRHCAYWVSLEGLEESENISTKRVRIPSINRFDPDALQELIERSRERATYFLGDRQ